MAQRFIHKPLNEEEIETVIEVEKKYSTKVILVSWLLVAFFLAIIFNVLIYLINRKHTEEIQKLSSQVFELQKPHKILTELWEIRNQNKKLVEKTKIEIKKQEESIKNISQATDIVEAKIRCYRESTYKALDCSKDYVDYTKEKMGLD